MGLPVWLAWMVQVPAISNEAFGPETLQIAGVVDAKLTGRPELAVAVSARIELADWTGICSKMMDCVVFPVPMPLNARLCCDAVPEPAALSALSVNINVPLKSPADVGAKLMSSRQD